MPHLTPKIPTAKNSSTPSSSKPQQESQPPRKDSSQNQIPPSDSKPRQPFSHVSPLDTSAPRENRHSPSPPPTSPITPKTIAAQLATYQPAHYAPPSRSEIASHLPPTQFIERPKPVPINESENTDAIALRSAIALLQLQKERSRRDILALERVRGEALRDPGGFLEALRSGEMRSSGWGGVLGGTVGGVDMSKAGQEGERRVADSQGDEEEEIKADSEEEESESEGDKDARFPPLPTPQNIFRCPPINWAKYHISGEPLERMHEEQRVRPTLGEPESNGGRPAPYVLAAPYSPLNDQLAGVEHPMQTRKGSKKVP